MAVPSYAPAFVYAEEGPVTEVVEEIEEDEEPNFNVAGIEDVILIDQLKTPEVVVTNKDGVQLKEGTDYTVEYMNYHISPRLAAACFRGF